MDMDKYAKIWGWEKVNREALTDSIWIIQISPDLGITCQWFDTTLCCFIRSINTSPWRNNPLVPVFGLYFRNQNFHNLATHSLRHWQVIPLIDIMDVLEKFGREPIYSSMLPKMCSNTHPRAHPSHPSNWHSRSIWMEADHYEVPGVLASDLVCTLYGDPSVIWREVICESCHGYNSYTLQSCHYCNCNKQVVGIQSGEAGEVLCCQWSCALVFFT